jgi:hypothetical protein
LTPGRADVRPRPEPTKLATLFRGSSQRTRAVRPSSPRITESRLSTKAGRSISAGTQCSPSRFRRDSSVRPDASFYEPRVF